MCLCKCVCLWTPRLLPPPQDYPKLSQSFYSLLEVLTQDHMNFIASLEPHVVMYILSSISEGLTALGEALTGPSVSLECVVTVVLTVFVCFRYDGVHRLLLQSGSHRYLPVQAAVPLHKEASHPDGHGRSLPPHHAAASRDDPAGQRSAHIHQSH